MRGAGREEMQAGGEDSRVNGPAGLLSLAIPRLSGHLDRMESVTQKLKAFLQFVAVGMIDDPSKATLKVAELGPNKLRFKLVLTGSDVAILIGRNGFTASAIRGVMKAAGEKEGVQVSLLIHSHEEEAQMGEA